MIEQLPGVMDATRVFNYFYFIEIGALIGVIVSGFAILRNWDRGGNFVFRSLLTVSLGVTVGIAWFVLGTVALPSEPTLFVQPGGRALLYKPKNTHQYVSAWYRSKIAPKSGVVILPCREETREIKRTIVETTLLPSDEKQTRKIVWQCSILLDDEPEHVLARYRLKKTAEHVFGETWEDAIFAGVLCWSEDRASLTKSDDPDQRAFIADQIERSLAEECEDAQGVTLVAGSVKFQIF